LSAADLYLHTIDFRRYLGEETCTRCGFSSCDKFVEAVREGRNIPSECPFVGRKEAYALNAIRRIENSWPEVPLVTHPRPAAAGLVELNSPGPESLVLISGNNEYTQQVVMTVLATTVCPFFVLFVDTDGNTVDMAMVYGTMTAERIHKALDKTGLYGSSSVREMVIPGISRQIKDDIEKLTGWTVRVGPVCAAELPLFLSGIWDTAFNDPS
jgi:CO dehydrogenase/acetyl-CoA synthase gamma subunit (corrinoid Fe-S protein)